jgi:hypothetical protein
MNSLFQDRRQLVGIAVIAVIKLVAAIAVAVVAFGTPQSAHAASEAAFQPAFQQFNNASMGDNSAVEPAAEAFETLLKAEPANPVLMAYAGASLAMKATTTMAPWKKMSFAEDGMAQIDKALAMLSPAHDAPMQHGTPGSLEVKFVAANTFLRVPSFMNRGARGSKLLADVLASPLFPQSPLPFQGAVWMRAAALATKEQRPDDATRYLNEVISRNAPQAEKARAMLKGGGA